MIYTIENNFLRVDICSLGATINKFIFKKTNTDIVLGFDNEEDYLSPKNPYFGATIGRYANRIGNGSFTLNGITYHTPINDKVNTLHGGKGIAFKEFSLLEKSSSTLLFSINSKDGDDGFPGNVIINVKYELLANKLILTFTALSDKDTVLNLTNHSYFNLNSNNDNALNHELKIMADKIAVLDKNGLSTEITKNVNGTSFDFREFRTLKDNLQLHDDNLSNGGIDHNFVYECLDKKELVTIRNNKLSLSVYSDLPGMQVYTANSFNNLKGKYNRIYDKFQGIAIEPQFYPNAINYANYLKPIVKANQEVKHYIEYIVEEK